MLEIHGKIHDKYTLEFKVGYSRGHKEMSVSNFVMDTWIFIPDALYINDKTYSKANFYRDVRTLVRLITPVYSLKQLGDPKEMPLSHLFEACNSFAEAQTEVNEESYEHQIKMFCSMVRSATRNAIRVLEKQTDEVKMTEQIKSVIDYLRGVTKGYRDIPEQAGLNRVAYEQRLYFEIGDEYLCRVIDMHLFRAMNELKKRFPGNEAVIRPIYEYLDADLEYQKQTGILLPKEQDEENNKRFLHRAGQLKKYIESDLYILAHKKSNTFMFQQLFFMFAAGLSMVFATIVSFSFQQTYGNFTLPLFIALVVSYMLKDRIKDLMHYWFSSRLGSRFYDYKIKLAMHGKPIGWGKEGCDFVNEDKVPREVRVHRGRVSGLEAGHCSLRETVIVHRHQVALYGKRLSKLSHYPLPGVNEIIRINLRDFLRRTDAPHVPVYINEGDGKCHIVSTEKVYYLHFVMRIKYEGVVSYRRYRIQLSRRGIKQMTEW